MFTGISPVLEVPFHDDGRLDADGFGTVVDRVFAEISRRRGWFGSAYCRAPGYQLDSGEMAMIDRFCAEFLA